MLDNVRRSNLPPPTQWTTISDEVRIYPDAPNRRMTTAEYNRWADEHGPLQGDAAKRAEREYRKTRYEMDR
jgi:hypothetical protein